ncbi:MAG: hypothetical protein ACM3PF_13965 [Bacteroidota bacterium]
MRRSRCLAPISLAAIVGCLLAAPRVSQASGFDRPSALALELDGAAVGFVHEATGGDPGANVITTPGPGGAFTKHVGNVTFSDIELQVGSGLGPAFYDWIAKSWTAQPVAKSGAILFADVNLQVSRRKDFTNGWVTRTSLPAFDGASRDPVWISVKIKAEQTRLKAGAGTIPSDLAAKGPRPLSANGYRLEIPGLDCTRVRKIDPFTIEMRTSNDATGSSRDGIVTPTGLNVSDLVVTLPEASADSWFDWMNSFVVQGNNGEAQEKNGDLVILDGQSEVARVHFVHLGIHSLGTDTDTAANAVRSVVARLYCEQASLEWKGGEGNVLNVRAFGRSDE